MKSAPEVKALKKTMGRWFSLAKLRKKTHDRIVSSQIGVPRFFSSRGYIKCETNHRPNPSSSAISTTVTHMSVDHAIAVMNDVLAVIQDQMEKDQKLVGVWGPDNVLRFTIELNEED